MTLTTTDTRLDALESELRSLVDYLLEPGQRPEHRAKRAPILSAGAIARVLDAEAKAIDTRIRTCPPAMHDQAAWCILLAAYRARTEGKTLSTTALGSYSHTPVTTSLRWLELLVNDGFLRSGTDPKDARRRPLELTAKGAMVMSRYAAANVGS